PACGGMNGGEIRYEYELAVRIRKRTEHCNEVQNCHSRVRRNVERRSIRADTARGQDWRARSAVGPDRADRQRRGGRDQQGRRDSQRGRRSPAGARQEQGLAGSRRRQGHPCRGRPPGQAGGGQSETERLISQEKVQALIGAYFSSVTAAASQAAERA